MRHDGARMYSPEKEWKENRKKKHENKACKKERINSPRQRCDWVLSSAAYLDHTLGVQSDFH